MSGLLGKIPKFILKLPAAFGKVGRTMSECPLELSFSLCDEIVCSKHKYEEQDPLQVRDPSIKCEHLESKTENQDTLEKAEEEKSEKEENMEVTCSVSIDGQEKQEFSFTLYEFDAHEKIKKEDVERVVVRSICEALGKTLKLPPSGSRTIKVKLAISPDGSSSSKECDIKDAENDAKWPSHSPEETTSPVKAVHYSSVQSVNTASTYLPSSTEEKNPSSYTKFCANHGSTNSPNVVKIPSPDCKPMYSPKSRSSRQGRTIVFHRPEMKNCISIHDKRSENENLVDNRHQDVDGHDAIIEPQVQNKHQVNKDHSSECRERKNRYVDVAGLESIVKCESEPICGAIFPPHADANYICPQRILDRTHVCSAKSHRTREVFSSPMRKPPLPTHPKVSSGSVEMAHTAQKTKLNAEPHDDLLNLNFDLCDLVPDVKFDWEKVHHRRSKSFDIYENEFHYGSGFYSPRLKHKGGQDSALLAENHKIPAPVASSPSHHHRNRHREREKQRAMQQVANWIEHSSTKQQDAKQVLGNTVSQCPQSSAVQRHEHHHLHEHVHHHYHHFVEF